jgi:hypothetical protein
MPLDGDRRPAVYVPLFQLPEQETAVQSPSSLAWIVRTGAEPMTLAAAVGGVIADASGGVRASRIPHLHRRSFGSFSRDAQTVQADGS